MFLFTYSHAPMNLLGCPGPKTSEASEARGQGSHDLCNTQRIERQWVLWRSSHQNISLPLSFGAILPQQTGFPELFLSRCIRLIIRLKGKAHSERASQYHVSAKPMHLTGFGQTRFSMTNTECLQPLPGLTVACALQCDQVVKTGGTECDRLSIVIDCHL